MTFNIGAGSWEQGVGSWEQGAGSWEHSGWGVGSRGSGELGAGGSGKLEAWWSGKLGIVGSRGKDMGKVWVRYG